MCHVCDECVLLSATACLAELHCLSLHSCRVTLRVLAELQSYTACPCRVTLLVLAELQVTLHVLAELQCYTACPCRVAELHCLSLQSGRVTLFVFAELQSYTVCPCVVAELQCLSLQSSTGGRCLLYADRRAYGPDSVCSYPIAIATIFHLFFCVGKAVLVIVILTGVLSNE